jgi:hypothetical protein
VALGVFSLTEAIQADVSPERLRRGDIVRLAQGFYALRDGEPDHVTVARAVCRNYANTWMSGPTGGMARGLTLPESIAPERPEVSRQRPGNVPRLALVTGRRAQVKPGEVTRIGGIPVSTPARVWLELASSLTVRELVEFGDHLVRNPRKAYEDREEPFATIADLRLFTAWHPQMTGADRARDALELIRVGADSVKETQLRLALVDAGLPEPELQVKLDPGDPHSPVADLGYRGPRIAIDYDGATHLTPEQQSRDIRRSRAFTLAGWRHVTVNRDDAAEGFRTVVGVVRSLLAGNG